MSNITTKSHDMFEIMDKAYKFAGIIAKSDIIPTHYRGKPENVFIAVQTAYRMNIDPMLVMQNTFVVNGKLGMNTAFAISLANQSGIFKGPFKYIKEGEGDNFKVTAKAIVAKTGEEVEATVSLKTAVAEGWTRNSKYKTMPEHMLTYRAAIFLIRVYCPEVINGMHTVEELEDVKASEIKNVSAEYQPTQFDRPANKTEALSSRLTSLIEEINPDVVNENHDATTPINLTEKENLINELSELVTNEKIDEGLNKLCEKLGINSILEMDEEQLYKAIDWAKARQ